MGAKRTGHRKHFFIYLACCITLFITESACRTPTEIRPDDIATTVDHAPSSVGSVAQTQPDTIVPRPVSDKTISEHLDAAYLALANGNYTTASSEIEMASVDEPPVLRSETFYLTGLLYADPANPTGDRLKAYETLQRIDQEFPDSDRAGEIRVISELLLRLQASETENDRLRQEVNRLEKKLTAEQNSVQRLKSLLNKMKEIDLGLIPEE